MDTADSRLPRLRIPRYAEIYWLMIRNSLIREMSFKANFLLWMIVELLWFLGQILFLEVLFSHVDRLGDWSKWECVCCWSALIRSSRRSFRRSSM